MLDPAAVAALRDLTGGDPTILGDIADAFLDDVPGRMAEIGSGLADDDAELVRRAAHTLKGNGSTFGAVAFAEACRALEEAAKAGDLGSGGPMADEIERTWRGARPAIEALSSGAVP